MMRFHPDSSSTTWGFHADNAHNPTRISGVKTVVDAGSSSDDEQWIVQIDPDIADLVPGFLENRRRDIVKATNALVQNDFPALAMLGHTMKGAGAGYGFDEITVIGGAMESAAKQADGKMVQSAIERLTRYLEQVEVRYE